MANVETNWSSPKISPRLMLVPNSWVVMKSRAYADSTTYSAYQEKNATVIGKTQLRSALRNRAKSSDCCIAT